MLGIGILLLAIAALLVMLWFLTEAPPARPQECCRHNQELLPGHVRHDASQHEA